MVRLWAEKELRNLTRMHNVGLPVPKPRVLKSHVLLMDFIGKDGWPAPKLKVCVYFEYFHLFTVSYWYIRMFVCRMLKLSHQKRVDYTVIVLSLCGKCIIYANWYTPI